MPLLFSISHCAFVPIYPVILLSSKTELDQTLYRRLNPSCPRAPCLTSLISHFDPLSAPLLGQPHIMWCIENLAYGFFCGSWVWCTCMVDKLYHIQVSDQLHLVVEIKCFVCDRTTPPIFEKLRSKGVAMHAYCVSTCYAWPGNQLMDPGWSHLKWT